MFFEKLFWKTILKNYLENSILFSIFKIVLKTILKNYFKIVLKTIFKTIFKIVLKTILPNTDMGV